MKKLTKEEFIAKAREKHGNLYNYSEVEYISNKIKVKIWCNKCEEYFEQRPNSHIRGNKGKGVGCPKCDDESQKLTKEEFITKAREVHGNRYNYSEVEYISNKIKVKIWCNKCEEYFEQKPNSHLCGNKGKGSGCLKCYYESKKLTNKYIIKNLTIEEDPIVTDGIIQCRCAHCKEYFIPSRAHLHNRIRALSGRYKKSGEVRLYCSDTCKNLCPIFGQQKYPKGFEHDASREVQGPLREMVLERDQYTCQICDAKDIDLICHHYTGVEINPIESADIDNCITLCNKCHNKVHEQLGCNYNDFKRKPCKI